MSGSAPDTELIKQAMAGDTRSFALLCERHRTRVWRIAASVARGADAEDIAQDVVLRAYRALPTYRGPAPFEAWLCRIAVNASHDYCRSAWRRRVTLAEEPRAEFSETAMSAELEMERRELQRRVRQAVAALPEKQRVPIWLHFFEGFPVSEVARLDGSAEATIRSRVRAGLRRLASSLDDLLPTRSDGTLVLEPNTKGCGA
ncbi:MAG: RNA polymerase sigma factor [Actinomycetota bacterium]